MLSFGSDGPVPQAAAELCGDAASGQRPLRPQAAPPGWAAGLRQDGDLQPAAQRGAAGENHQTGQAHLPPQQVVTQLCFICLLLKYDDINHLTSSV